MIDNIYVAMVCPSSRALSRTDEAHGRHDIRHTDTCENMEMGHNTNVTVTRH